MKPGRTQTKKKKEESSDTEGGYQEFLCSLRACTDRSPFPRVPPFEWRQLHWYGSAQREKNNEIK